MNTAENDNISEKEVCVVPYDPPYDIWVKDYSCRKYLKITFQSLVGISESLAKKYSIDSIKSLCEFSSASAEEADRERIEELQKNWAPGNWMLRDLSCNLFCQDSMIAGKLARAGIVSVWDFLTVDNFAAATTSSEYRKACKRFQIRLQEAGFPDFIEKQRVYHELQWQKKLEKYPVANVIEPDCKYCLWECGTLKDFVLAEEVEPSRRKMQFELRKIYPEWKHIKFTPDNFIENIGQKRVLQDIFKKNIETLDDFLKYDFEKHETLSYRTRLKLKEMQKNIFPAAEEESADIDVEKYMQDIRVCDNVKDALRKILGEAYERLPVDTYIQRVIDGKTLDQIAKEENKTREAIRNREKNVSAEINAVVEWENVCKTIFNKFGRIGTIKAVEAKGSELLGNELGKIVVDCLHKYKNNKKHLVDNDIHTEEKLGDLKRQLALDVEEMGRNKISKDEFFDICFDSLEKYFKSLSVGTDYISPDSLWDILKPDGRNENNGETVVLMNPYSFIRHSGCISGKKLFPEEIVDVMKTAGFTGKISKNNIAARLGLVVYEQVGMQFKYILSDDVPQLPEETLDHILFYIKEKLKTADCIDLSKICDCTDFSSELKAKDITPFVLKAILKQRDSVEFVFDNTAARIWKKDTVVGLEKLLEAKLKKSNGKVLHQILRNLAAQKGYAGAFANALDSSKEILIGGDRLKNYCLHIDHLDLKMENLQSVFAEIEAAGEISAEVLWKNHRELCEANNIEDARLLGSILKKCSIYYVDYPQIMLNRDLVANLRQQGLEFVKNAKWRSKSDIDHFYLDKGYRTQWWTLLNHPELIRIADDYIAHKENIGWQEEYALELLNLADNALKESGKKYMKIVKLVYDLTMGTKKGRLPELKISWSHALISDILSKSRDFAVMGCNNCIFIKKEEGLQTFEDICYWIKKEEKPADIIKYLSEENIISESWKYVPENKEFIDELMEESM